MLDVEPLLAILPPSFTTGQANAAGLSHRVLTRLVRHGLVLRTGHGVYRKPAEEPAAAPVWVSRSEEHRSRCAELLLRRPGHAISHLSAALVHGLPVTLSGANLVEATSVERAAQSRREGGVLIHHCDSLENETVTIGGLRVTTLARTLADVARQHPFPVSVPLLDAAGRSGAVDLRDVEGVLAGQVRWTGRRRGFGALSLADIRRESWLESHSFVVLHVMGLPMPVPQVEVYDEERRFVGRLDGLLREDGVALECDGAAKYTANGDLSDDVRSLVTRELMEQNRRQLRLESLGLAVVRWTTPDITLAPDRVLAEIQRARRTTTIGAFTGFLRIDGAWWRP